MVNGWEVIGLLLLLLVLLVGVAVVTAGFLRKRLSCRRQYGNLIQQVPPLSSEAASASSLLCPGCWLAIKSVQLRAVQAALRLRDPQPCSWMEGLTNVDRLFIAPPIAGWILVTGSGLPDPVEDVDACFRFVLELSRKLGTVQLFSANRSTHHHAWVHVKGGRVVRAYAWAGTTLWQQGEPTPAEKELELQCYDYGASPAGTSFGQLENMKANIDKLPLLAGRWGLDPAQIEKHCLMEEHGIAGNPAHHY